MKVFNSYKELRNYYKGINNLRLSSTDKIKELTKEINELLNNENWKNVIPIGGKIATYENLMYLITHKEADTLKEINPLCFCLVRYKLSEEEANVLANSLTTMQYVYLPFTFFSRVPEISKEVFLNRVAEIDQPYHFDFFYHGKGNDVEYVALVENLFRSYSTQLEFKEEAHASEELIKFKKNGFFSKETIMKKSGRTDAEMLVDKYGFYTRRELASYLGIAEITLKVKPIQFFLDLEPEKAKNGSYLEYYYPISKLEEALKKNYHPIDGIYSEERIMPKEGLFPLTEISAMYGVPYFTLMYAIRNNKLSYFKVGDTKGTRVSLHDVDVFLLNRLKSRKPRKAKTLLDDSKNIITTDELYIMLNGFYHPTVEGVKRVTILNTVMYKYLQHNFERYRKNNGFVFDKDAVYDWIKKNYFIYNGGKKTLYHGNPDGEIFLTLEGFTTYIRNEILKVQSKNNPDAVRLTKRLIPLIKEEVREGQIPYFDTKDFRSNNPQFPMSALLNNKAVSLAVEDIKKEYAHIQEEKENSELNN